MEFNFPDVGEGITEGKLIRWLVKEGQEVKAEQPMAEVETDKAVVEIPAPQDAFIAKLLYKEGDTLHTGKPMLEFSEGDQSPKTEGKEISKEETRAEHVKEARVSRAEGVLATPAVRKAAKEKGIELSSVSPSGKHGQVMLRDLGGTSAKEATPPKKATTTQSKDILATPSTRRLARELKVDINSVIGTGDHGMITKEDIENAAKRGAAVKAESRIPVQKRATLVGDERIPMTAMRKAIAKKMLESKHSAAHVTLCDDADVSKLVDFKEKEKGILKEKGIKLTYLPFFIKAVVSALQKHPYLNSQVDGEDIVLKKDYNIGIATDTDQGLLVPIIEDADKKSIIEIAKEIMELAAKAKDRKLSLPEMTGGTFTITSVGSLGITVFTPIINYPEVAVLGIGKINDRAIVKDGKIVVRKVVTLSLSVDHRIIDGAEAARFLNDLIVLLEDPDRLLMEMT
ncbi:MAG: 2-oxo acid dehydrogenase subunit E2 [Nanoarchaeota archaeon]